MVKKRHHATLTISAHRPLRKWLSRLLILLTFALLLWGMKFYSEYITFKDYTRVRAERTELREEVERLTRLFQDEQIQLANIQRSKQVDDFANESLKSSLVRLQQEKADLKSELSFYQGLVDSGGQRSGLAIYGVRIHPTDIDRMYRIGITLTQDLQRAKTIEGDMRISLFGGIDEQPQKLNWSQLKIDTGADKFSYIFKYFQQLDVELILPEGFTPNHLQVRLVPKKGGANSEIKRDFDWVIAQNYPLELNANNEINSKGH